MRIEAGINAPERGEASNHQSGADEENQCHGHLQDNEHALRAMAGAARSASAFLNVSQLFDYEGRGPKQPPRAQEASIIKTLLTPGLYVIRNVSNPARKTEEWWANPQRTYFAVAFAPLAASSISFATAPGCDT
jgi:hypothetical protein